MPELFIYLIKVNVALLVFCLGYYLVLRRLTFYTLNRVYLVTAIIFSTLYPRIDLTNFMNRHEQISRPVQEIVVNWQGQVNNLAQTPTEFNKWFWLQCIFWLGVAFLAVRMLVQLVSLYRLHRRSEPAQVQKYIVRTIGGNINPFSFWRNIYLNPDNHTPAELRAILEHEQIHVNEWHTVDILLGEISTIFYWFNPGIWLMKRAIRENLEFITDRKILQKGMDSKTYQYSLLNVNFGAQQNTIVNHFNISTIKKRIIMMNAKRSSRINVTRYVLLLPVVVLLLLVFSVSKAQLVKAAKNTAQVVNSIQTAVAEQIDKMDGEPASTVAEQRTAKQLDAAFTTAITDTTKKVKTVLLLNEPIQFIHAENDTNKHVAVKMNRFIGENTEIFIDGKKVEKLTLDSLNANTIAHINVFRNTDNREDNKKSEGYIFITTKGAGNDTKTQDVINFLRKENKLAQGPDSLRKRMNVSANVVYLDGTGVGTLKGKVEGVQVSYLPRLTGTVKSVDGKPVDSVIIKANSYYKIRTTGKATFSTDSNKMKEVVVVGYGTRSPVTVTGTQSSGSIKMASLDSVLKIIDGKEVTREQFKKLSAADIESIQVFKGEDAVKKYGEKGKKGVIVLTTKQ